MTVPDSPTLLLTLTGRDQPGVTAAVFGALGNLDVQVLDVEQVVIRERLVLGVLLRGTPSPSQLEAAVGGVASELGMEVEVAAGVGEAVPRRRGRTHVTLLAPVLTPDAVAGVAARIASCGANIDRIVRLAAYPVTSLELEVSGAPTEVLRRELAITAAAVQIDLAVQSSGLHRRATRLVVMDVDSTLVQGEVIETLAERAGCAEQVARVTAAAMRGELDFTESLRSRVALLAGLDAAVLEEVRDGVRLTPGARTLVRTLRRLGYLLAAVSGGFTQVTDDLVTRLGLDYAAANTLEIRDGRLTGRLVGDVLDRAGKAAALERFAAEARVPLSQTVAIGDGANDLDMIALAGLGIAFNAKPLVREAADAAVSVPYLDAILYLLGISREEVEEADAADAADVDASEAR